METKTITNTQAGGGDEDAEIIQRCLDEFHEILLSLPEDEKRAYLQAREQCPELIERESNPVLFLKYKDFHVWAAVKNFVEFWELRVEIYRDRAFLPINFTGQGALDDEDLELMESGEFCFLPDDIHGNPTILICPRKKEENTERFLKQCCCTSFAIRLVCAQRQTKEGYNVVYIPSEVSGRFMQMPAFARFLRTHDLIPSPQRGLFTLIPPSDEESSSVVVDGFNANKTTVWKYLKPLSGDSREEIFQKLRNGGFRKEGVPTFLGGTWDASEFMVWLQQRREDDYNASAMEPPKYVFRLNEVATSSEMDEKLREFHRILDSFSGDKKTAYSKARERRPELIERESHPLLFLRHQNFDVWAAVQNFVGFWELREHLLTEERAFLPLNLTGEGAIDEETCRWIESGRVAILPKDDGGNARVLLDTTASLVEGDPQNTVLRWLKALYFVRVLIAQRATSAGLSVLYYHNAMGRSIVESYSTHSDKFRMIPEPLQGFWAIAADKETADWLEANKGSVGENIKPVWGATQEELVRKLESDGFKREGLPASLGGSWQISAFSSWVEQHRGADPLDSVLSPPTYATDVVGPSERSEKLREFYAILSSLPPYEKQGYLNALERCPELVERELPPKLFLQGNNYHVWRAVQEFVKYWEFRQDLFGDRAFLPMNFTGKGAPDLSVIDMIASGEVAFLPPRNDSKLTLVNACSDSTEDIEIRAKRVVRAFFTLRVIVAHAMVDFSVIQRYCSVSGHLCSTPEGIKDMTRFTAIPPYSTEFFPILTVDSEEARRDFHNGVSTYKHIVWRGLYPFVAISDNEVRENLSQKGFSAESLPPSLGGSWDLSHMALWVEQHKNDDPSSSLLSPPSFAFIGRMNAEGSPDENDMMRDVDAEETTAEEAHAQLEEVIKLLPKGEEKTAYQEASAMAGDLILSESNPLWYCRATSSDAWEAAKRLTTYWHFRRRWFGERAHLPLDLSGNGALTLDDIEVLRDGTAQLLPPDKDGRPVVFVRRLPSHSEESSAVRASRLRILFYLMTLSQKIEKFQNLGIVLIIYYSEDPGHFRPFDWKENEAFTNRAVASRSTRCFLLSPQGATTGPAHSEIVKEFLAEDINILPLSSARSENADKLKSIGLSEAGIPDDLGGSWYSANFEGWLGKQHSVQTMACINKENQVEEAVPSRVASVPGLDEQYILLARLETALSDIGLNEKIDLLTARESAPALVASESPPSRFLRCENFDFSRAARRWCSYWKGRKKLFGAKALLPMKTYDTVLSQKEKACTDGMLSRSVGVDPDGRSIIAFSGRRPAESGLETDSIARCYFVVVQRFVENDMNQTDGIVMFREWMPSKFMPSSYIMMDEIVSSMMPLRISAHHLLCVLPESGKLSYYQSISSRLFEVSSETLAQKTNVHLADSKQGLKELMVSVGVDMSRFPDVLLSEVWGSCADSEMSESTRQMSVDDGTIDSNDYSPVDGEFDIIAIEEDMAKLDSSETAAFFESQQIAPDLVQKESNPGRFLLLEKNRRSRAVLRLARYWKERKRIFGERAFLPLDQTGEGALSKDDIAVLNSGFLSVLRSDQQNVPVGLLDGARAVPQHIETSLRIMFYVGSVLCEYDIDESMNCRFIFIANVLSLDCGLDKLFAVIETTLPTRIQDLFVLPAPGERAKTTLFDSVAPQVTNLLGPQLGKRLVVVKSNTAEKRCAELVERGFKEKALPMVAGGEWNFAQFFQWQETRIRIEWGLPLSTVQKASLPKGLSYNVPNLSELPESEQNERKRRLNLLHSRRKREKERAQIEALQDQVADLEETNRKLSEANATLEQAMRQASQYLPPSSRLPNSPSHAASSPVAENRKLPPALRVGSFDFEQVDNGERARLESANRDVFSSPMAAVAAPSAGNKRILEEFLLQQQRVSVPSNVWMHMMNQNNRQTTDALQQFLSNLNGPSTSLSAGRAAEIPASLPYSGYNGGDPPHTPREEDRKKRRF